MGPAIILFDGDCAFCNGWVKWVMERDPDKRFAFTPLSSEEGRSLRQKYGIPEAIDSIVLVKDNQAFTRSDAAWRVFSDLPRHRLLGTLVRTVPRPMRNWVYDLIARNRHRLGLKDRCELPEHHR